MISSSERVHATALPSAGIFAALRLRILQCAPFAAALVFEPWAAVLTPLHLLARHVRRRISEPGAKATPFESGTSELSPVVPAAIILLGICALIIVALKITDQNAKTWSDEAAWVSAVFMVGSIFLSGAQTRGSTQRPWQSGLAYVSYLAGAAALLFSLILTVWLL